MPSLASLVIVTVAIAATLVPYVSPAAQPDILAATASANADNQSAANVQVAQVEGGREQDLLWADVEKYKTALTRLLKTTMTHLIDGWMPAVSRARRATQQDDNFYLDSIVAGMGAVFDRQKCRARMTCKAGKLIQNRVPGAQVAVMLLESFVPNNWLDWYSTVKSAVINNSDNCVTDYDCELLSP